MRRMLREQAGNGRAVLVSSHLLAEVSQSVDDVVIIAKGEMRARGTLAEVLGGDEGDVTEVRAQDRERLAGALEARGHRVEHDGDSLLVLGTGPEEVGAIALEAQVALIGLAPRTRSLETAFFALTGGEA
jgi:ABC-2 type transport system ATP-binding protein